MSFAYPSLLPLLCIPVIIAFFEWFRKGQILVLPFDHIEAKRGLFWRILIYGAQCLPAALLAVAILVLAKPTKIAPPAEERLLTNIQFCLDVSTSMIFEMGADRRAAEGEITRFDIAMDAINAFTRYREGDAFGLTIFSDPDYLHWVPLTRDLSAIRLSVPFVRPTFPTWGGTAIGNALKGCTELLSKREGGDRMIILLTDGSSPDITDSRAQPMIDGLVEANIVVYAVSLIDGNPAPGLEQIARQTNGKVFTAVDPSSLDSVFKQIDSMKKTKMVTKGPTLVDNYTPFAIAGVILLLLYVLSLFGLRYNPW